MTPKTERTFSAPRAWVAFLFNSQISSIIAIDLRRAAHERQPRQGRQFTKDIADCDPVPSSVSTLRMRPTLSTEGEDLIRIRISIDTTLQSAARCTATILVPSSILATRFPTSCPVAVAMLESVS